jgi:hypothetical protein
MKAKLLTGARTHGQQSGCYRVQIQLLILDVGGNRCYGTHTKGIDPYLIAFMEHYITLIILVVHGNGIFKQFQHASTGISMF